MLKYEYGRLFDIDVRPQLLLTELDRRHTTGVVNCCQQTATVETCC